MLALGVVGASDQLHARLHATPSDCGHAHADSSLPLGEDAHEQTCAIELFAAGVSLPVDPTHVVVEPLATVAVCASPAVEVRKESAAHRQPPGRGPPQG